MNPLPDSRAVAWSTVDMVLLDMDGTLLDLHFDGYFWQTLLPSRYARSRGLDLVTARRVLAPRFQRVEQTLKWYCLDYWQQELGLDLAMLKREVAHLIAVRQDAPPFLSAVRAAGKRAVLVTNAHPESLTLKLEQTQLDSYLDRIICTHDLGLPKEAATFWQRLQSQEPFDPARTLLVDDNLAVLGAARDYGVAHLLAVCTPDSRQPPRTVADFPAIHSFAEVMPEAG